MKSTFRNCMVSTVLILSLFISASIFDENVNLDINFTTPETDLPFEY